jgi:hypothetical protein
MYNLLGKKCPRWLMSENMLVLIRLSGMPHADVFRHRVKWFVTNENVSYIKNNLNDGDAILAGESKSTK